MIADHHAVLLRWLHTMLIDINYPADFERACIVAHEVRE